MASSSGSHRFIRRYDVFGGEESAVQYVPGDETTRARLTTYASWL